MDCLVYVDPSERGEWAVSLAALLPPTFATRLTLLATEEDASREPQLLSRTVSRFAEAGRVATQVAAGPAEKAIAGVVLAQAYDLVIVPPAGRNAIQRMLRGSRVATVVRSVKASVLVARRPPARISRILGALSGGAPSEHVARAALELQAALASNAAFIHVASEVALPFSPVRPGAAASPVEAPASRAAALAARCKRELILREGLVVDEVIGEVENGAYDLLVIGASPEEAVWGRDDLAERILMACPTSILIVR